MSVAQGPGDLRILGRYELLLELAKGQLGPLWVARAGQDLSAIRRVRTAPPMTRADVDALSEAAWWALDLKHENIGEMLDVVMTENELGIVYRYVPGEPLR